jgi:ABC-2 type transport system permease protein/oleandomycin transport system permease protein
MSSLQYAFSDTLVLAKRSLLRIPRQPDLLIGFTVQPVMFVLLFVYVFGGAIETGNLDYAFSWVFAFIGLTASSPEAANAYGFTVLFPVTFVSSAFVPVESMPGWLEPVAANNPFTTMVDAARALFVGTPAGNDVWGAVVWAIAITAVFGTLSVWRYRRAVTR